MSSTAGPFWLENGVSKRARRRVEIVWEDRGNGDMKTGVVHTPDLRVGSVSVCHQPASAQLTVNPQDVETAPSSVH